MTRRPNVLVILTDQQRYPPPYESDELAEYRREHLPGVERLRQNGVSFRHHYPMAAACAPSRASLLTGQFPSLHGVTQTDGIAKSANGDDMFWLAPDSVPTLGDWFRAGGYRTYFKGKWHASHAHLDADDGDGLLQSIDDDGTPIQDNIQKYLKADLLDGYPFGSATCSRWRSAGRTARFTPGQNRAACSSPGTAVTGRSSRRCRRSRRGAGGAFHHGRGLTTSAGSRPIPMSPSACSSGSSSAESCTARTPAAASPTTGPGQSAMRTASPGIRRSEGRAYQAAGDGAAWSADGGVSWQAVDTGRDLRYCWALAVDPADPDRWYVSAASGPRAAHAGEDAAGRLYVWEDGAWRALDLPGTSMPYALAAWDAELLAAMADGRILHSADRGETWVETGVRIGSVLAMAVA